MMQFKIQLINFNEISLSFKIILNNWKRILNKYKIKKLNQVVNLQENLVNIARIRP